MDYLSQARRVFDIEIAAMQAVAARLDENFIRAVDLLRARIERNRKIVVVGVGKSGHIGEKIAATLTSTGSPSVVLNSLNALHGDLGIVSDGDAVLALSYSGETEELNNLLPALARFDVEIVAITGNAQSSLARAAHLVLDVSVAQEACPLNLAPTSSTTAMLALGDALAMVLLEARGFNKDDFARFHPGGHLGRTLLLRVSEIMRPADQLASVSRETPVLHAIRLMTQCRTGAAVVVEADGRLAGIFTHGDFARHFQSTPDIGARAVAEFMTSNPITIAADKLAAEVLHILQTHRIDDLVAVDSDGRPVGIVDSQDLSRHKLL
ncbi:MAG TPA: KpsF/GutQ family sugar-phosphate isomerase [Chthoniobacterales bacterium]